MGDVSSGIVTTQVDGWRVDSNTAKDEGTLRASLKPKVEAALSNAGKELGKKGAEAKAKAVEEKPEPAKEPEAKPEPKEAKSAEDAAGTPKVETEAKPKETKDEAAGTPEPEPETEEGKPLGKPRHDPRARMLEATRKEAEAKRAAAAAEQRARELEARLAALERGERPAPKEEARPQRDLSQKPNAADFDDYDQYLDARDEYNREQFRRERAAEEHRVAIERAFDEHAKKFAESIAPHADEYSGELLALQTSIQHMVENPSLPYSGGNWIADYLFANVKAAPALMLHLSKNGDELQRIAALRSSHAVSREMAMLEARLEAAPTGNGSKRDDDVSRAAPPVKPVTGKPYVTDEGYRPGMSLDEYVRWRKRQKA